MHKHTNFCTLLYRIMVSETYDHSVRICFEETMVILVISLPQYCYRCIVLKLFISCNFGEEGIPKGKPINKVNKENKISRADGKYDGKHTNAFA